MTRRARYATMAAALLAVLALGFAWRDASLHSGVDAYQFWVVGRAVHNPGPLSVYRAEDRSRLGASALSSARASGPAWLVELARYRSTLETFSTPFLYTVAAAAATGDYEAYLRWHRLALLFSLAAGVAGMARMLGFGWPGSLAAIALFGAGFEPFRADMQVGNVGSIQLLLVMLFLALATHARSTAWSVAAGAVLGVAVAFKPNLVFVPALLVLQRIASRRHPALAGEVAGGMFGLAAGAGISILALGEWSCWNQWADALRHLPTGTIDVSLGNFAPAPVLASALGADILGPLALVSTGLAIAAMMRTYHGMRDSLRPEPTIPPEVAATTLGCLLVLLATRLAWHHYFVLAIPALLLISRPIPGEEARLRALRMLLAAACFAGISVRPYLDPDRMMQAQTAGYSVAVSSWVLFVAATISIALSRPQSTATP